DLSYNTKLKVTTAKYYIPSGRCIQALDYSHRNEDGSVGHVPDSLISEFTTKKGRKVYDGGGVVPDIKIDGDQLSRLSVELITRFMIFDFATKYANENESIPEPEDFVITDDIYSQFKTYIKASNFEYDSRSQDDLKELLETAKSEKYYGLAKEEFEALEAKLKTDIDKDLGEFRPEISELLESEIVSRYYYQKGSIRSSINEDKGILKTIDALHSANAYASYFQPGLIVGMN
ncbi:MAG TPA: peptidase S41, partial [Draconibacterium sp.]|nr:peptidase S41 [Draconibacterium sp.]